MVVLVDSLASGGWELLWLHLLHDLSLSSLNFCQCGGKISKGSVRISLIFNEAKYPFTCIYWSLTFPLLLRACSNLLPIFKMELLGIFFSLPFWMLNSSSYILNSRPVLVISYKYHLLVCGVFVFYLWLSWNWSS